MSKNVKKLSRKILCLAISTIMVFGTMLSTVYAVGADIDPMQEFILEAIDLDDDSRADFVEILDEVNSSNYKDYVDEVSGIISLSDEDITLALKTYAGYSSTYKASFLLMLESFELSEVGVEDYTSFGFRRIQKAINFEITGDYYDDRGIRLFVSIFRELKAITGKDAFSDKDVYKLDINLGSTALKTQLNKFITTIKSLTDRKITTFDGFVAYAENVINAHDNNEIYSFKKFLKTENLGYTGSLTKPPFEVDPSVSPIQQLYLKIISLTPSQRVTFYNDVLDAVNSGNISTIRVKAQKYLGSMPAEDIEAALKAFAAFSDDNKGLIKLFISSVDINDKDYSKDTADFSDIYERINFALTGEYDNQTGFAIFYRLIRSIQAVSGPENFIKDGSTDQYKIKIDLSKLRSFSTVKSKLDIMIGSMGSLNDRGINNFKDFVAEAEAIINAHPNDQIYAFKKYLDKGSLGYEGNLPDPSKPVVTPTVKPTDTVIVTPTPTVTSTAIVTSTPKPGDGSNSGGNGGNSGGSSGNSGNNSSTPKPTATTAVEPTSVVPGADQFTDLSDKHWAKLNMLDLVAKKILAGYTDGTIKPDAQITRAEMSVIIVKAVGLSPAGTPNLKFKDNKDIGSWASGYIQTAVDKGIIVGYEDNTFRPSNKLTREEMVVMIMKAYAYKESTKTDLGFSDKKDVASWSMGYVAISVELGFVKGYPDNSFKPKNNVTRAEASAVIANCMKEAEKNKK